MSTEIYTGNAVESSNIFQKTYRKTLILLTGFKNMGQDGCAAATDILGHTNFGTFIKSSCPAT